jgi:hypothetical protein
LMDITKSIEFSDSESKQELLNAILQKLGKWKQNFRYLME